MIVQGRGRVGGGQRRAPLPRRDERRLDGADARSRPRQDLIEAARKQAEQLAFVHNERLTNPAQEQLARDLIVGRARRLHACALRDRRRGGQRDRAAHGSQLPRRARRPGPLARDLARAGLPRPDDGDAGADRPRGPAGTAHAVPARAAPHPAEHVALRPDRRAGARGARCRRWPRSGPESVAAYFSEVDQRRRPPRLHTAAAVLGGPGRATRAPRLPDLLRRGRHRCRTHRQLVRRRQAALHARHHRHREGPRRRLRGDRRGALSRPRLPGVRVGTRASSPSATPGTVHRCRARSAWR